MSIVPTDRRSQTQKVAQMAGDAELGSLALDILDELEDDFATATTLSDLQLYQLGLLATFFESAARGALQDLRELATAHRAAAAPTEGRPYARQPTLDDDERRWELTVELVGNEDAAKDIVDCGMQVLDAIRAGDGSSLQQPFVTVKLVPFLDRLAHVDRQAAEVELDGYHSLYG